LDIVEKGEAEERERELCLDGDDLGRVGSGLWFWPTNSQIVLLAETRAN